MQLGFVIDQTRCIGCHACTVVCKSENDVQLGSFRTWVKYTEQGQWPDVRRSFGVLRCNQCSDAPCVTICPVTAIAKRPSDGIVDVDPDICIGCKACMQGCPYDSIHIDERHGTARKCHFCAHRTERGLAPACAVVCPTEAIIPGDLDDPHSHVSTLRAQHELTVRKPEAGTRPNVFYREATPATLDPTATNASGGYLWAQARSGVQMDAETWLAAEQQATTARTVYDTEHAPPWGAKITGYLYFKSLSAGLFLVGALHMAPLGAAPTDAGLSMSWLVPLLALLALAATMLLLVTDLKRPERFLLIMLRPNWDSWLARGSFILMGYGGVLALWLAAALFDVQMNGTSGWLLLALTVPLAGMSAAYTALLFAQAKGRALWMKQSYGLQLLAQACVAGGGLLLVLGPLLSGSDALTRWALFIALALDLALDLGAARLAPHGREAEYQRALSVLTRGPLRAQHRRALWVGKLIPLLLLTLGIPFTAPLAGALALWGLYQDEDAFVRAGQAVPIS